MSANTRSFAVFQSRYDNATPLDRNDDVVVDEDAEVIRVIEWKKRNRKEQHERTTINREINDCV